MTTMIIVSLTWLSNFGKHYQNNKDTHELKHILDITVEQKASGD